MNSDPVSQLASIVARLIGSTCWRVSAGGVTGSRFNLDFGEKMKWGTDAKDHGLNVTAPESSYGECGVQVGCASWRLDSDAGPITACTDVAAPRGAMVAGLGVLRDCVVTGAEVTMPGLDLVLTFDEKYVLRVFCDQFDESCDNYSVSFRNTYVSVTARSRVVASVL